MTFEYEAHAPAEIERWADAHDPSERRATRRSTIPKIGATTLVFFLGFGLGVFLVANGRMTYDVGPAPIQVPMPRPGTPGIEHGPPSVPPGLVTEPVGPGLSGCWQMFGGVKPTTQPSSRVVRCSLHNYIEGKLSGICDNGEQIREKIANTSVTLDLIDAHFPVGVTRFIGTVGGQTIKATAAN